ncbi:MAG: alpha/beta hydrolase family protein [Candidatus Omnitrophica bacterium]|nr:alpha/beta hydrolase family protein [Candidatus Omnitrophota bacterium]
MQFYQYTKVKEFNYTIKEKVDLYTKGILSFPSAFTSGDILNDTVSVDIFQPRGKENWPAVILLHSLRENRNGPTEWLAKKLVKNGFGAYLLHLPYHINRAGGKNRNGSLFITADVNHSVNAYRQSVIDIMTLCDWLEKREEVTSIGITGLSLGAIILNTVMGIDNRIKAGVSILGGGNIHYIFTRSVVTLPLVIYGIFHGLKIRDYKKVSKDYVRYLREVRKTDDIEKVPCPWLWFLLDPLTYAHLNQPRNVLMVNARFDLIIPYRAALQLWEALGRPEIIWLPSTHITATFFHPTILYYTLYYLKKHLT